MSSRIALLLPLLGVSPGVMAAQTVATADFTVRTDVEICDDSSGSWVCTDETLASINVFHHYYSKFAAVDTDGDGVFGFVTHGEYNQHCEPDSTGTWSCSEFHASRRNIAEVQLFDYDGDGTEDVMFADTQSGGFYYCDGTSSPLSCSTISGLPGGGFDAGTWGDLDNDGFTDLIAVGNGLTPQKCFGDASGSFSCSSFTAPVVSSTSNDTVYTDVALFDANSDGFSDLWVEGFAEQGNGASFCINDGTGSFSCSVADLPQQTYNGSNWATSATDVHVADMDCDGNDDLAVGSRGIAYVCWSDGAGALSCDNIDGSTSSAVDSSSASSDTGNHQLAVADLDGDSLPDIVRTSYYSRSGQTVSVCTNLGDDTFDCSDIGDAMSHGVALLSSDTSEYGGECGGGDDGGGDTSTDGDGVCDSTDTVDTDGDSVMDDCDAFPEDAAESVDSDGDGIGDNTDTFPGDATESADSDGDGIGDNADLCDTEDATGYDLDADGCLDDTDGDGLTDNADYCPDEDATGYDANDDGCIDDTDGDGVLDSEDAFPDDDTEWSDMDGDGTGDNADAFPMDATEDADTDGDEIGDNTDTCHGYPNDDTDGDGVCDSDDSCPTDALDADEDDDGVCDVEDICVGSDNVDTDEDQVCDDIDICDGNDASGDYDGDGLCGDVDNCPADANADQADDDGDDIGNVCDDDDDGDAVADTDDNCPDDANADQSDLDGDGDGDACDSDDDGDGIADESDNCPFYDNADQADSDGDGYGDECDGDDDGDGVADEEDLCAGTPLDAPFDSNGCSGEQFIELKCGTAADYSWRRSGKFTRCVVKKSMAAQRKGLITKKERQMIIRRSRLELFLARWRTFLRRWC